MGQWAYFREVSPRLLARLVEEPRLSLGVLALRQRGHAALLESWPAEARGRAHATLKAFQELKGLFPNENERERWGIELLESEGFGKRDSPTELDIEKRWRFLSATLDVSLARDDRVLGFAVVGGTEVGEDLGYGPLRYFTPEEVSSISRELSQLTEAEIVERLQASHGPEKFESVWGTLQSVSAYYSAASSKGFAMLLFFG